MKQRSNNKVTQLLLRVWFITRLAAVNNVYIQFRKKHDRTVILLFNDGKKYLPDLIILWESFSSYSIPARHEGEQGFSMLSPPAIDTIGTSFSSPVKLLKHV